MPISLIGLAGLALYIYLGMKFQLVEKYGFLVYIGLPVFVVLFIIVSMLLLAWLGIPLDLADDCECVKWDWATGDCTQCADK